MKTRRQIYGRGKGCADLTSMRSVFRPLIASSLALALGVSVVMAADPSIKYNNGSGDTSITSPSASTQDSWKWTDTSISNVVETNGGNFFQLQDNSDSGNVIQNLTIAFDKLDSSNNPQQSVTADTSGVKTLGIKVDGNISGNDAVLTFSNKSGGGKGIILGDSKDDKGTLTFNFLGSDQAGNHNWNENNETKKRKIVLDLSDTTTLATSSQKVSLIGNIEIKAGMGIRNDNDSSKPRPNHQSVTNTNVFEATFGGDVIGNIAIDPSGIKDPNILNPNGTSYSDAEQTGYRDITSTFTFSDGASLQGNILANTGNNIFVFEGRNGGITGNITADNGVPSGNKNWIAGTDNEYYGAINKITFSENGSIIGDITASNSGQNIITFNSSGTIQGNILSGRNEKFLSSSSNHNNFIVFKGASAEITNSSLKIINGNEPNGGGNFKFSNNIILFSDSTTASLNFSSMSVGGDYGQPANPATKTFNLINFEGESKSSTIDSIHSVFGNNVIAKGLVSDTNIGKFDITLNSVHYNNVFFEIDTAGFGSYSVQGIKIKNNITTEFLKSDYSAQGTFTIGTNNTVNAISTGKAGLNLINISGNTIIKGNILSTTQGSGLEINHNNILVLTGNSATLGASDNKISIKINNSFASGAGYGCFSTNTLILGSQTNSVYLSELNTTGNWIYPGNSEDRNLNILSFNNEIDRGEKYIDVISASFGNSIIGKDIVTQGNGYSSKLFKETDINGSKVPEINTEVFLTEFIKAEHGASGTFIFGTSKDSDAFSTSKGGKNYVNINGTTTIKGNIQSGKVSGLTGHNNLLVLTGNSATLGASDNKISIKIENKGLSVGRSSNNTILLNTTTTTLNLAELSVTGDWAKDNPTKNLNIVSINSEQSDQSQSIDSMTSLHGANIIAKNMITQTSGYDTTLFGSDMNTPQIQNNFFDNFKKSTYKVGGSFAFKDITANSGGKNYINVDQLSITGTITASGGANYLVANSLTLDNNIKIVATGGGINNIIATNGDVALNGVSTKDYNVSAVGNNIDLGTGNIVINARTNDNDTDINGKAIYAFNGNNNNSITAQTITINGDIAASGGIPGYESHNSITGKTITVTGDISGNDSNKNNFTLNADNATLTLNGKFTGETTHQITSLTATTSGTNTLTLDNTTATSGSIDTTINSVINGQNLAVVMKGKNITDAVSGTREEVALILTNTTGTTLKSLTLANGSDGGHRLVFGSGVNSVLETINIEAAANRTFTLDLNGSGTSLNLAGLSGATNINIKGANTNATLSGGAISAQSLVFDNNNALTIKNTSASFDLANVDSHTVTLTLDGSNNATNTLINKLQGDTLSIKFNGQGSDKGAILSILDSNTNNKTVTLKSVSVENGSTNNTLDLSNLSTVRIDSAVSLTQDTGLALKLKDTNLTVTGGTDSRQDNADTNSNKGALTISVDSGVGSSSTAISSLTTAQNSEKLNITNLEMVGSGKTTVSLKSNTEIANLAAQSNSGNTLEIDSSTSSLNVTTHTLTGNLGVVYKGASNTGNLVINGGTHTLSSVGFDASGGKGTLTLKDTNTTIASNISATADNTLALTLTNSNLKLSGATNTISSLTATDSKSVIDLATTTPRGKAGDRKTLTISDYKQGNNAKFIIYADTRNADKVTFSATDGTKDNTSATISVIGGTDLFNATYVEGGNNNVMVADASNTNAKGKIDIKGGESYIGGVLTVAEVKEGTNGDEGKYYIGKIEDRGLGDPYKEVANTALTVNYDLFLANFNSLNKRMGELRDNPHSNGVWARVFGGNMSNDFGAGSKTDYITAQGGYDYALSLGDAKNYIGVAIAYGKSWTKSNSVSTGNITNGVGTFSLDEVDSNMVEVGIYNSYVADSGWYNDTIFKFDYIMSEFSLSNDSTKTKTNNFAMVLSDEFGYRYKFAENEKGNWYIDPQAEVAFGYFNQSDFNRAIFDANNIGTDIKATQDSILALRTRAGLSLGKKFNTERGFASLYVGAFYEYDYVNGGDSSAGRVGGTITQLDKVESNGRAIVNVGSNIGLTENARLYIDVEKSFGDKQRTDMQFNFGARYSF